MVCEHVSLKKDVDGGSGHSFGKPVPELVEGALRADETITRSPLAMPRSFASSSLISTKLRG